MANKKSLEAEKRRLFDLQVLSESTTAILDGMPHSKPLTYKIERITALIVECENRLRQLAEELVQAKCDLLNKLQALNWKEIHLRILNYHYVSCLTFNKIAKLMNFSLPYVSKLHYQALKILGFESMARNRRKKETRGNKRKQDATQGNTSLY